MLVTILKLNGNKVAVSAEMSVGTLEQLVSFTHQMGYEQSLDEYVSDFNASENITYILELDNGLH